MPAQSPLAYSGSILGRLTLVEVVSRDRRGNIWKCLCSCGKYLIANQGNLIAGNTKSCGCLKREVTIKRNFKHGLSRNPIYRVWQNMILRCEYPRFQSYPDYGAKGISVCDEWHDIEVFYTWAKETGYKPGLSIERDYIKGNYNPANCRWIPVERQACNTSRSVWLTAFGETKIIQDWLDDPRCSISRSGLEKRLSFNWSVEQAIIAPRGSRKDA